MCIYTDSLALYSLTLVIKMSSPAWRAPFTGEIYSLLSGTHTHTHTHTHRSECSYIDSFLNNFNSKIINMPLWDIWGGLLWALMQCLLS